MSNLDTRPVPTSKQLMKASGIAAGIATAVLVLAVLPAEYGIDPTGAGKALGLDKLHGADAPTADPATAAEPVVVATTANAPSGDPVSQHDMPFSTQEMSLTLQPNQGAEIKAKMKGGDSFSFSWKSDVPVNFDMHGEPLNAKGDEFTSYWKDLFKSEAHGSFVAPFDGTHGWYWRNRSGEPATVTVVVSGYFEKLYRP